MSEKFSIDSDFNVFDEWGKTIGKFTPKGGGLDGLFMIFTLIFVGIIGFAIYAIFRVIIEGFSALGKKNWNKAILYLIPLWLPLLIIITVGLGISVQALVQAPKVDFELMNPGGEPTGFPAHPGRFYKYIIYNNGNSKISIEDAWNYIRIIDSGQSRSVELYFDPAKPKCYYINLAQVIPVNLKQICQNR